jgi:hypothetical protein
VSPELWIAGASVVVAATAGWLSYKASMRTTTEQVRSAKREADQLADHKAEELRQQGALLLLQMQGQVDSVSSTNRDLRDQVALLERKEHTCRVEVDQLRETDRRRGMELEALRHRMLSLEQQLAVDTDSARLDDLEQRNRDRDRVTDDDG